MRKLLVVLAVLAVLALLVAAGALWLRGALAPPSPLTPPGRGASFSDVTLIEPGVGRQTHRFLEIDGAEIGTIADARTDPDDPYLGAFVLPGLNDLHVHFPPPTLPGQTELWSLLFLMHGVTGVRDAGDVDGASTGPAIRGIESGAFPGPRVRSCGAFVDGPEPVWGNSIVVRTPEEARRAVERLVEAGADCVKAYDGLDGDALAALREAAHAEALPVIGHVPRAVPFEEALLDDAQHLIGVRERREGERRFPFDQVHWADVTDARVAFVIEQSLRHDLSHTPTLVTAERLAAQRDPETARRSPDAALLPRLYRDVIWHPDGGLSPAGWMEPRDFDAVSRALERKLRVVKQMHDAGVVLHSGSDALVSFVVPGASLHRELRLLARAGLSAEQALAVSTGASAGFLDVPALGSLRPGAPAELVLFREDPTRDLAALDTLIGVVRDGRLYAREDLLAQHARYLAHFDGPVYDRVVTPLVRRVLAATLRDRPRPGDGEDERG